jgi:hypothetical protein
MPRPDYRTQPLVPRRQPGLQQAAPSPGPHRGLDRGLFAAIVAVLIAGGAVAAAILLTQHRSPAAHAAPAAKTGARGSPAGASGAGSTTTSASPPGAAQAVVSLLRSYANAYSDHTVSSSDGAIFGPNIERIGESPSGSGCSDVVGRANVLAVEEEESALINNYVLVDLSASAVQIHGDSAFVPLHYLINSNEPGWINFMLSYSRGQWLIEQIHAVC